MKDREIPAALRGLLQTMRQHPADSPVGRVLANRLPDIERALDWLDEQTRRVGRTVVFSLEIPGFVWLGVEGEQRPVPDPNLAGLSAAWEIFFLGENAPFVLFAADRGTTPDALRISLRRAATWAERYCTPLAVAIRAIKVHDDGSASSRAPAYPVTLRLGGVFSAYSESQASP